MMQQLLDALKAAKKAYMANICRETYNVVRYAADCLYRAIFFALLDDHTVRIAGQMYHRSHMIYPDYIETISLDSTDWIMYIVNAKYRFDRPALCSVRSLCLSAADKVVVI